MITIQEASQNQNDVVINGISGKVAYAKQTQTKETPYGIEQSQWVLIEDNTGKAGVTIVNKPPVGQGEEVSFESTSGKQGFNGVKVKRWVGKDGSDKWGIRVTGSARMCVNGEPKNTLNKGDKSPNQGPTTTARPAPTHKKQTWNDLRTWVKIACNDPILEECGLDIEQKCRKATTAFLRGIDFPTEETIPSSPSFNDDDISF